MTKKEEREAVRGVTEALTGESTPITVRTTDHDGKTQEHVIDGKPFTMLVHQGGLEVDAVDDDIATITAEDTVREAAKIPQNEWDMLRAMPQFIELFKLVFPFDPPVVLAKSTIDVRHVVGMLALIAHAIGEGKRPFIKLPETYLHPANQGGLASLLVRLTGGKK